MFQVGDRVVIKSTGQHGTVVSKAGDWDAPRERGRCTVEADGQPGRVIVEAELEIERQTKGGQA